MARRFDREAAELEANEIAFQFRNSHDVVGDMSRAYHTDFSGIRMHEDADAQARVRAAGTDALAKGSDLYFRKGILGGHDPASRGLVAHELAHTMQQGIVTGSVQESAPAGAEQGGFVDWIKGLFSRGGKKKKQQAAPAGPAFAAQRAAARAGAGEAEFSSPSAADITGYGNHLNAQSKMANIVWNSARNRGIGSEKAVDNTYKTGFGLGLTNTATQTYTNRIHETLFKNAERRYGAYMKGLNVGGLSQAQLTQGGRNNQYAAGTAEDMLGFIGDYLMSEPGMEYASSVINNTMDAKVFAVGSGSKQSPVDFLMRSVLETESGKAAGAIAENGGGAMFGQDVKDSMLYASSMSKMSEGERMALPPHVQSLFEKYKDITNKLVLALAEKGMLA